ncbi:MAG: hypothetical protein ACK4E8_04755 [Lacibacter sp.]
MHKRFVKNMKVRAAFFVLFLSVVMIGCSVLNRPKEGCPSIGKNVGAEKILSGEKLPKAKKFKS